MFVAPFKSPKRHLSVVSLWEATITYQLGKLPLPERPNPWLSIQREHHGIQTLPLDESSVARLSNLEAHYRDRSTGCSFVRHFSTSC